jgi:hypothetical protein
MRGRVVRTRRDGPSAVEVLSCKTIQKGRNDGEEVSALCRGGANIHGVVEDSVIVTVLEVAVGTRQPGPKAVEGQRGGQA